MMLLKKGWDSFGMIVDLLTIGNTLVWNLLMHVDINRKGNCVTSYNSVGYACLCHLLGGNFKYVEILEKTNINSRLNV